METNDDELTNSRLRAIIAGHEGLMFKAAIQLANLHEGKHDWLKCNECNTIERIRRSLTHLVGDC